MLRLVRRVAERSRAARADLIRTRLPIGPDDLVLDLGSDDGAHLAAVLPGHERVVLADISATALQRGRQRFGFAGVQIGERGDLPFRDGAFAVVFCNSVIEHVTVDKAEVWQPLANRTFHRAALRRQQAFAREIRRVGRGYIVQTPSRSFPIESHTLLPGVIALLPRRLQIATLRLTNRFWPVTSDPDWRLLTRREMQRLFPDAEIVCERWCGLTKSLIAIKLPY